jgi:hypothetical protein
MPDGNPQESGAASVATHVTSGSNAFEGALDGLDFGLDLFGMDSMPFTVGMQGDMSLMGNGGGANGSGAGGYGGMGGMDMQM